MVETPPPSRPDAPHTTSLPGRSSSRGGLRRARPPDVSHRHHCHHQSRLWCRFEPGNWNAGGEYDGVESLAGIGHTNDSEVMSAIDRERKALRGAHGDGVASHRDDDSSVVTHTHPSRAGRRDDARPRTKLSRLGPTRLGSTRLGRCPTSGSTRTSTSASTTTCAPSRRTSTSSRRVEQTPRRRTATRRRHAREAVRAEREPSSDAFWGVGEGGGAAVRASGARRPAAASETCAPSSRRRLAWSDRWYVRRGGRRRNLCDALDAAVRFRDLRALALSLSDRAGARAPARCAARSATISRRAVGTRARRATRLGPTRRR